MPVALLGPGPQLHPPRPRPDPAPDPDPDPEPDPDFGTADLPMMLDLADLPASYRRRFIRA